MTDALDTIYNKKRDPELTVIQDKLLRSYLTLNMLLVADVFLPVNVFFFVVVSCNLNHWFLRTYL